MIRANPLRDDTDYNIDNCGQETNRQGDGEMWGKPNNDGWRMASPAKRLAILAACADTSDVLIDRLDFVPRCVDEFSKRIGIWGSVAASPLPHHRTCESRKRRFDGLSD
jgi:hypothetical protein